MIILILSIFIVLVYILFLQSKENFVVTNSDSNTDKDVSIDYTLNNTIDGPIAYLKNIHSFGNGFYEQLNHDNPTNDDCRNDEECGINGICLTTNDISRCNKVINKEAFKFIPEKKSHIVIPIENPESIVMNFIVLVDNVAKTQPIIVTSNNTWELYIDKSKFLVNIYSDKEVKKIYTNFTIKNNKLYEIILKVDKNFINISLDKRIFNIPLLTQTCINDSNCLDNGSCIRNSRGSNYCSYSKINLILGKKSNEYFGGYIGDITYNIDTGVSELEKCEFDPSELKNKRICLEECNRLNTCDQTSCSRLCNDVQQCEFEPTGRHAEDCIQLCINNNDCTSKYCTEKCRNCGKSCPWNMLDQSEKYDSDYYDKLGRPSPSRISILNIATDGRKISLRWKPPYEGNSKIDGYTLFLHKTFDKSEGVKINNISTNNCGEYCNYVLSELNPSETYTIGIKGYNSFGLGKMSNLLTFKPDKKSISKDFSVIPNIDESNIGEFNYCNIEEE